jgi:Superinfection immunity protein
MEIVVGLLILAILLFIYFFPAYIASFRKKKNTAAIFVLNLFFGWTVFGWVLALIWAFVSDD